MKPGMNACGYRVFAAPEGAGACFSCRRPILPGTDYVVVPQDAEQTERWQRGLAYAGRLVHDRCCAEAAEKSMKERKRKRTPHACTPAAHKGGGNCLAVARRIASCVSDALTGAERGIEAKIPEDQFRHGLLAAVEWMAMIIALKVFLKHAPDKPPGMVSLKKATEEMGVATAASVVAMAGHGCWKELVEPVAAALLEAANRELKRSGAGSLEGGQVDLRLPLTGLLIAMHTFFEYGPGERFTSFPEYEALRLHVKRGATALSVKLAAEAFTPGASALQ